MRLAMASAVADERHYWEHECASVGVEYPLCQFDETNGASTIKAAAAAVQRALEQTPLAPAVCYRPEGAPLIRREERRSGRGALEDMHMRMRMRVCGCGRGCCMRHCAWMCERMCVGL